MKHKLFYPVASLFLLNCEKESEDQTPVKPEIVTEVRYTKDFGTWEITTEDARGIEFVMYVNEKDKNYKRYHKGDTIK